MRPSPTSTPRASYTDWSEIAPNFGPDSFGHAVGGDMGLPRHRPQDGQTLGRHLKAVLTKEIRGVSHHRGKNRSNFGMTPRYFSIRMSRIAGGSRPKQV